MWCFTAIETFIAFVCCSDKKSTRYGMFCVSTLDVYQQQSKVGLIFAQLSSAKL